MSNNIFYLTVHIISDNILHVEIIKALAALTTKALFENQHAIARE
jgi:hypothetical protein